VTLKAPKPQPSNYPKTLKTLGDHIRKTRLELGLFQREVAKKIGVTESTVWRWERNETSPPARFIPAIITFLGCDPSPPPRLFSESLLKTRKLLGLTQKAMARRLGVDPTTLARWEHGQSQPSKRCRQTLKADFVKFCV